MSTEFGKYNVFDWIGSAASAFVITAALFVIWNIVRDTEHKVTGWVFSEGFLVAYGVLAVSNWFDNTSSTFIRWFSTAAFAILAGLHLYFWNERRKIRKIRERARAYWDTDDRL